jgi:hypothetical protein
VHVRAGDVHDHAEFGIALKRGPVLDGDLAAGGVGTQAAVVAHLLLLRTAGLHLELGTPSLFGHMLCVIVLTSLTSTVAARSVCILHYTRDKPRLPVAMAARTDGLLLVDASSGPAAHGVPAY